MAPFGKIYSYPVSPPSASKHAPLPMCNTRNPSTRILTGLPQGNPRTLAILAVAKANNLELEQVHTEPAKGVSDDYRRLNKLGRVPTFEGQDGYVLSECMAIAIYGTWNPLLARLGRSRAASYDEDQIQQISSYPCLKFSMLILYSHSDTALLSASRYQGSTL